MSNHNHDVHTQLLHITACQCCRLTADVRVLQVQPVPLGLQEHLQAHPICLRLEVDKTRWNSCREIGLIAAEAQFQEERLRVVVPQVMHVHGAAADWLKSHAAAAAAAQRWQVCACAAVSHLTAPKWLETPLTGFTLAGTGQQPFQYQPFSFPFENYRFELYLLYLVECILWAVIYSSVDSWSECAIYGTREEQQNEFVSMVVFTAHLHEFEWVNLTALLRKLQQTVLARKLKDCIQFFV